MSAKIQDYFVSYVHFTVVFGLIMQIVFVSWAVRDINQALARRAQEVEASRYVETPHAVPTVTPMKHH